MIIAQWDKKLYRKTGTDIFYVLYFSSLNVRSLNRNWSKIEMDNVPVASNYQVKIRRYRMADKIVFLAVLAHFALWVLFSSISPAKLPKTAKLNNVISALLQKQQIVKNHRKWKYAPKECSPEKNQKIINNPRTENQKCPN